jgi:hypothetical protein
MNNIAPDLSVFAPAFVVFLVIAALGTLVSLAVIAQSASHFVVRNHRNRVARHESIPTYYRRLVTTH